MSIAKVVLWLFIALCAAVLAICAYVDPWSMADSIEHFALVMAYVGLLVVMADLTIRYKE